MLTVQINCTYNEIDMIKYTLPHHIRLFYDYSDSMIISIDNYFNKNQQKYKNIFIESIKKIIYKLDKIDIQEISYDKNSFIEVENFFSSNYNLPLHDYRGRPIYAYLYCILKSPSNYIFHLDSDMLFGGQAINWFEDAITIMKNNPNIITCSPLAGAPTTTGNINQNYLKKFNYNNINGFLFNHFSSRVFLIDKNSLFRKLTFIKTSNLKKYFIALYKGHKPFLPLEDIISNYLKKELKYRLDFLGSSPGLYSIHPIIRGNLFINQLPKIIEFIENNNIKESFRGEYNLTDIPQVI